MQARFAMNERQTQSGGRLGLYPEIVPCRTGRLKVSALHELYYEECGNPDGKPAVLLHGGPGGGSTAVMRRYHDPSRYRIILFDQRGCGRSTPHASIEENTTWHLVDDIEQLRERCEEIFHTQVAGLAKRLEQVGDCPLAIGISGGLDSTHALIVAARAFDRLGYPRKDIL